MRHHAAVLLLVVLTTAAVLTGCAGTAAQPEAAQKNTADLYGTWTKSDWEAATPEEKELAVVFLISEAAASQGSDEEVVQTIVDEAEQTLTSDQYAAIEDAITAYFDKSKEGATLQDALNDVMGTITKYVAIG